MAKTTYKVGDKVRVLEASRILSADKENIQSGGIYEVVELFNGCDWDPMIKSPRGGKFGFLRDELQYIEKVEESDAKMTQFKVGDKVRVINADGIKPNAARFKNVEIAKVMDSSEYGVVIERKFDGKSIGVWTSELGCIELVSPKPTKNQRISTLEKEVETLKAEIDALKAAQKPKSILSGEGTLIFDGKSIAKVSGISYKTMTPNGQRKAIIDEAKAFVEEMTAYINSESGGYDRNHPKHGEIERGISVWLLRAFFEIKPDKNEVTVVLKPKKLNNVVSKGIAKCAPGDVFNADIGKAIALGRALGLDVERFEKAVQPSEVVTGMHVDTYYIGSDEKNETCPTFVTHVLNEMPAFGNGTHSSVFKITDDTEAQY